MKQTTVENQIIDVLDQLSYTQQRFVIARLESDTDGEAAEKIGINQSTVSRWPERELIKKALTLASLDAYAGARAVLRRNAIKAAMVKVKGLDSSDERIAQQAAREILEWTIDLPVQTIEWRDEAKRNGYDPDQLYRDMVNAARQRMAESGNSGSDTRGNANPAIDSSRSEDAA